jgi:glycosyltransferase involved in cell wall biosynthesis
MPHSLTSSIAASPLLYVSNRLLIISTTFFPDPAVAAIRMTQWCRHLPKHGWKPHVLCRYYGFDATREALAENVHPDATVEYLDRPQASAGGGKDAPVSLFEEQARRFLSIRSVAGLFVPDLSIRFWRKCRQQVLQRTREIQPDLILTTSPPHSIHDLGLWLAAQTAIPWVADFRDPYLIDDRFRPTGLGLLRMRAHLRFTAAVYRRAWLITHAIPIQARWAVRRVPFAKKRIRVLTNAFPTELLDELRSAESRKQKAESIKEGERERSEVGVQSERRTVLVTGTIPEPEQFRLAEAVAVLASEGNDVQLKLIGKRPSIESELRRLLGERLVLTGYVSHRESVREVARADVLVNYLDQFRQGTRLLSTKLFEYLASGKPVICINSSHSDRLLLRGRSRVKMLTEPSMTQLRQSLGEALAGQMPGDAAEVEEFRKSFNWPARATTLAQWLDDLVSFPPKMPKQLGGEPKASVVMPARNRKELLRSSIRSALAQTVPVEVIVMDDGSTDGAIEMVEKEFPEIRLYRLGDRRGPSFQRNRGLELASTPFVFAIDDDSVFSSSRVVEQTLAEFDHPRVAAVAIPFLNPRLDWQLDRPAAGNGETQVAYAFVGASHAVRRDIFLNAGGYREHFFYMGEEGDLCLRLLSAGFVVKLGKSDPIYHLESPLRNLALADFCGRRNDVLFAWHNVPMPYLPFHLAATTANGVLSGIKTGHLWRMIRGTASGYAGCWTHRRERSPVASSIYRLSRRLKKRGPAPLDTIEDILPTI